MQAEISQRAEYQSGSVLIIDDDTVYQEFDQLPALGKGQLVQGRLNAAAEVLDAGSMQRQITLLFGLCIELRITKAR